MLHSFAQLPVFYLGLLGSLLAGLATGVGALPILFLSKVTQKFQGALMGFGAGVMLAATSFSLVIPGIEAATEQTGSEVVAASIVTVGMILGGLFLCLSHRYSPHEHFIKGPEGANPASLKRIWLFIIAITIHNFPEGLAVGVGFGGETLANGITLATGIGLQNMPEGFVVALALVGEKYSKWTALLVALMTGLVEPVGGAIGAGLVSLAKPILPWAMAFAAGTMLFVISDEIIPESHRLGYEKGATFGVILGFVSMMFLDVTLS
ncbi:ZIP family metal transporter [Trichocoleus sp. FACHB-591]|uniref:ZIP family metal transporter n=1 Tax=Trichocoleus sp. FACHB-591 TaxID=2692872 RepID=UPI001686A150|nr:ZIP family metal transporter [Trichocoleus sp. FACHB-591]MBD2097472.1 ZIP family metal transporter [Trichocoleus sp. FACHB-591]